MTLMLRRSILAGLCAAILLFSGSEGAGAGKGKSGGSPAKRVEDEQRTQDQKDGLDPRARAEWDSHVREEAGRCDALCEKRKKGKAAAEDIGRQVRGDTGPDGRASSGERQFVVPEPVRRAQPARIGKRELDDARDAIAKYVAPSKSVDLATILDHPLIPVPPWADSPVWRDASVKQRLTMLFDSAKRRSPANAEKLLAILSRRLAAEYETVKYDKVLGPYHAVEPQPPPVQFHETPRPPQAAKLGAKLRKALAAIATYLERGGLLTVDDLIADAHLSRQAADRIRQNPPEEAAAIIEAILTAAAPAKDQPNVSAAASTRKIVARFARRVARSYETASFSESLAPFLPSSDYVPLFPAPKVKTQGAASALGAVSTAQRAEAAAPPASP